MPNFVTTDNLGAETGVDLVGAPATAVGYTPTSPSVLGHIEGVLASAGGGGASRETIYLQSSSTLATGVGQMRIPIMRECTFVSGTVMVGGVPVGADIIADLNLDGTTIYTTQANRPTITDGANSAALTAPDVTTLPAGSYLSLDIDQVGSGTPGSDLCVGILVEAA